jgi:hypothetical protein
MFSVPVLCAVVMSASLSLCCMPDEELDQAVRPLSSFEDLVEGVDYVVDDGVIKINGSKCYAADDLRCNDQAMSCAYMSAGKKCVYCNGAGGTFEAIEGFCARHPHQTEQCTTSSSPAEGLCGKQKFSTCSGIGSVFTCTTVIATSNRDCRAHECTP